MSNSITVGTHDAAVKFPNVVAVRINEPEMIEVKGHYVLSRLAVHLDYHYGREGRTIEFKRHDVIEVLLSQLKDEGFLTEDQHRMMRIHLDQCYDLEDELEYMLEYWQDLGAIRENVKNLEPGQEISVRRLYGEGWDPSYHGRLYGKWFYRYGVFRDMGLEVASYSTETGKSQKYRLAGTRGAK